MAPVIHECEKRGIDYYLLHTGQHYSNEMSQSFFDEMDLRNPDCNLDIGSGTHADQTAKALVGVEKELLQHSPSILLVEGDTNAVLSAALAAVKLHVPVGHIEAGLRSYDFRMPEEHNRRLTDHVSDLLFAPTETAAQILQKENVWGKVYVTGNTVIDALENSLPKASEILPSVLKKGMNKFALLTLHRAENVDDRNTLEGLLQGILSLGSTIVFPAHPRTVKRMKEFGYYGMVASSDSFHVIKPTGYLDFLALLDRCSYVLTDSGGIQEEVTAPSINKKVFVLRTSTERPEAVESGQAEVVGVDPNEFPKRILRSLEEGLDERRPCPYGAGDASVKIVDILLDELG